MRDSLTRGRTATCAHAHGARRALFGYEGRDSAALKVVGTGSGGLPELGYEFDDGKLLYAFVRVLDDNTQLPKFVFIAWVRAPFPALASWRL